MIFRAITLLLALVFALSAFIGCDSEPSNTDPNGSGGDTPAGAEPKKRVALTFDDGPQHYEERTKKTVDELSKYGYHATFFVVGNRVPGGDALKYAVDNGNEIGIHGFTHEQFYDKCEDVVYEHEISKTLDAIHKQIPNYDVKLMRPVGGRITDERAAASPYSIILWSVDSTDYEYTYKKGDSDEVAQQKIDTIVDNVMSKVKDGSIILMHDIYESTYDATVVLLRRLYEEGYEVVTVSELIGDGLKPGETYYSLFE